MFFAHSHLQTPYIATPTRPLTAVLIKIVPNDQPFRNVPND